MVGNSWFLRAWLFNGGWIKTCPCWCTWAGLHLFVRAHAQLVRQRHILSDGWRAYGWDRFLTSGKHEVAEVFGVSSRGVLRFDLQHLPRVMSSLACCSVAVGATLSPAWFHHHTDTEVASECDRCDQLGWSHMWWGCPQSSPVDVHPARPACRLLRRLGWELAQMQNCIWRASWDS